MEDELADAVIRLFDLAGLRNINLNSALKDLENSIDDMAGACKDETFVETVYAIATLPARYDGLYDFATSVNDMIFFNIRACQSLRYRFALAHQSEDEIQ